MGVTDNFFDLGGHSLKATQVVARMKKELEYQVPLKAFFEAPTIASLREFIREDGPSLPPIEVLGKREHYALSHAQQRLWFLEQMVPGQVAYNMPSAFELKGELDLRALERALGLVVSRHESLRTRFTSVDGEPVQVIGPVVGIELEVEDLGGRPAADLVVEEALAPFDLETGPLYRLRLYRVGDLRHLVVFTMHHIISDGWSMEVLLEEVLKAYAAYSGGKEPELPELRVQYRDYAAWQNALLEGGALREQEEYWLSRLGGETAYVELPADHGRPAVLTTNGASCRVGLGADESAALKELARGQDATLFMVLLSALDVWLYRLTGQTDVTVGSPIAGRNHPDLEGLIGFFVNTLALRSDLGGDPRFTEVLRRVKATCVEAYAHQDYPFDQLIDILKPARDTSRTPLFSVMFAMQDASRIMELAGGFGGVEAEHVTTKFDLTVFGVDLGERVEFVLEYNRDLFEAGTMARLGGYLVNLLREVLSEPGARLSAYRMVGEDEYRQVVEGFNATAREYPREATVVELFEAVVERQAGFPAVVYGEAGLSYGELNARANALAHRLRGYGVGPGVLVGMMVGRPVESIIAIMGIVKAGGAYLPIDADYPAARVEYIVSDSGTPVVVTVEEFLSRLPGDVAVVCLDRAGELTGCAETNPARVNQALDAVYAIYTSGSTGRPKGTLVPHRGVVNLVHALYDRLYGYYAGPLRVALLASYSFDASVQQIFGALLWGHALYPVPGSMKRDMGELIPYVLEQGIEVMDGTPSLWELLVAGGLAEAEGLRLRHVIIGGEALPVALLERFFEGECGREVCWTNVYGVTESSVDSTGYEVRCGALPGGVGVPIGSPLANTRIYILDRDRNPVPVGVPGELYIAGDGLALEYLNNPERTKASFVADVFHEGKRMYRSGDLARWLPDGNVEFLGRLDHQVKIRGFRIELGEIEAVLSGCEGVEECVVVDRVDAGGDRYLAAYYVGPAELEVSGLRANLGEKLPDYMIPSRFAHLEALPLNTSGKIDRLALPEVTSGGMSREYVAPRDAQEEAIARVWAEVLSLERVGVTDNFFDLGGHSLLIMKILGQLKLTMPLTVQDFFDYQSVAELAELVRQRTGQTYVAELTGVEQPRVIEYDISLGTLREAPQRILLTGATGYLGSHLLGELLDRTGAEIVCTVRAETQARARTRLQEAYAFAFPERDLDDSRVRAVPADIGVDGLGLGDDDRRLVLEADTILHAAADVRHFGTYAHFDNVNVKGTARLLELAHQGQCHRFHYISTLSVIGESVPGMAQVFFTEMDYDRGQRLANVYARSKFTAEGLVRAAMEEGLAATIYRVGNLTAAYETGRFQRSIDTNAFYALLRAMVATGVVPDGENGASRMDLTPVDACRRAVVELMLLPETAQRTLHVFHPHLVSLEQLAEAFRQHGYAIQNLTAEEFLEAASRIDGPAGEALDRVLPYLAGDGGPRSRVINDCCLAGQFLEALGFEWPRLDQHYFARLIDYGAAVGFLPGPEA